MKTYTRSTGETFEAEYLGTERLGEAFVTVWQGSDFYRVEVADENYTYARFYLNTRHELSIATQLLGELHRWCLPIPLGDKVSLIIEQTKERKSE